MRGKGRSGAIVGLALLAVACGGVARDRTANGGPPDLEGAGASAPGGGTGGVAANGGGSATATSSGASGGTATRGTAGTTGFFAVDATAPEEHVDSGPDELARQPCLPTETLPRPSENGPCEWPFPAADGGIYVDRNLVNVVIGAIDGAAIETFLLVSGPDACNANDHDWYYDDARDPTHIELCPAACAELRNSPGTQLSLLFGCAV